MSTCLLSVVIDMEGEAPTLYHVLCLNPALYPEPCSYHDGLSLPPSPRYPSLSYPAPQRSFTSPTCRGEEEDEDNVFASDIQSTLEKPSNFSPQVGRKFKEEESELQMKLLHRRAKMEQNSETKMDPVSGNMAMVDEFDSDETSQFSGFFSPPYSNSNLIPAIKVTPSDPGVMSPPLNQPQNVEFIFESVLEYWKSFEYVKVGSCKPEQIIAKSINYA